MYLYLKISLFQISNDNVNHVIKVTLWKCQETCLLNVYNVNGWYELLDKVLRIEICII